MRALPRYVLMELMKVFLIVLIGLTLLMLLGGVANEARAQGLGPAQFVRLIPYMLPQMLRLTLPATILFTVCMVYGRMAGSNEVVAIKALGINPMTIIWPALGLSFLLSLLTVCLNDLAISWGRNGMQRVVVEAAEEIAYGMLRTQSAYNSPRFSIIVKSVEGRKLIQPTLSFQSRGDQPSSTIRAAEAELRTDLVANVLNIELIDGEVDYAAAGGVTYRFDAQTVSLPLGEVSRKADLSLHPSWLPLHAIPQQEAEAQAQIEEYQRERAVKAAFQLFTGDIKGLTSVEWRTDAKWLTDLDNRLHRLETEPHRRWADGFSCLCFVMVGAPWAIRWRNSDVLTSFFLCFVPILLVYFPLLFLGVDRAKNGAVPPYTVWSGNLIMAGWGIWELRRVIRY